MLMVISEQGGQDCHAAGAAGSSDLWLKADELAAVSGWELKPEGLCKGEVCVPIPAGREAEFVADDTVHVSAFWDYLDKPVAHTESGDVWYLGEGAEARNDALLSLSAPDFTLPDFSGRLHSLTDFRRQRVLLITWASW